MIASILAAAAVRYNAPMLPGFSGSSSTIIRDFFDSLRVFNSCGLHLVTAMIFSPPDLILIFLKVFFSIIEVGELLIASIIFLLIKLTPSSKKNFQLYI